MMQATERSVETALAEILGIEGERALAEEQARRALEEEMRRRSERDEHRRVEAERRRAIEEEERVREREERERDERERRERERRLAELRVRQEVEARARLAEEELRLRHERELAAVEGPAGRIPTRARVALVALGVVAVAATALALLGHLDARSERLAAAERSERDRVALQAQIRTINEKLDRTRADGIVLRRELERSRSESRSAKQQLGEAESELGRLRPLEEQNRRLRDELAEARGACSAPGPGVRPPRPPSDRPPLPPPVVVPSHRECIHRGTPLEECFSCPGDPRC